MRIFDDNDKGNYLGKIFIPFNAKKYWEDRTNPNAKGHDRAPEFIYDFVLPIVKKKNVFELGPGVGRMLDIYNPSQAVTTLDLSRNYVTKITDLAQSLSLNLTQYHIDSPSDFYPFLSESFDIGVCIQVLMHVEPKYILHTITELTRINKELVFITALEPGNGEHVFKHDYLNILSMLPVEVIATAKFGNTGCFYVRRN